MKTLPFPDWFLEFPKKQQRKLLGVYYPKAKIRNNEIVALWKEYRAEYAKDTFCKAIAISFGLHIRKVYAILKEPT